MRTVHPSIVIGSSAWDQDRLPRDEFQTRRDALNTVMDANGWRAILIYGDAVEHAALAYYSGFTPRLRWAMALLPREGEPRAIAPVTARDVPATKLMTWIDDVHPAAPWRSAFEPWLGAFDGDAPVALGSVGFDRMRPAFFEEITRSLRNRFRLDVADDAVAGCRTTRPRELSIIREASRIVRTAADAFVSAWRHGEGAEFAALACERSARMRAPQDMRTLVSFNGGRTLQPFRGAFEPKSAARPGPLLGYAAVKTMGYWADLFITVPPDQRSGTSDLRERVDNAFEAVLQAARPGVAGAALYSVAAAKLTPMILHSALSGSVGHRIGLSVHEGGDLTADADHALAPGEVYTLRVGAHDPTSGGIIVSAMVAITQTGAEILHRSPRPVLP